MAMAQHISSYSQRGGAGCPHGAAHAEQHVLPTSHVLHAGQRECGAQDGRVLRHAGAAQRRAARRRGRLVNVDPRRRACAPRARAQPLTSTTRPVCVLLMVLPDGRRDE